MAADKLLFELWSWARYYTPLSSFIAPFHAAPTAAARQLLRLGKVCQDDHLLDLGCGDGKLMLMAGQQPFGARCTGYELDRGLAARAKTSIATLGLQRRLEVREADARQAGQDGAVQSANVVFLYLSVDGNLALYKALERYMRPQTRLLSLAFPVTGLKPTLQGQAQGLDLYMYELDTARVASSAVH